VSAEQQILSNREKVIGSDRVWPLFVLSLLAFVAVIITQVVTAITVLLATKDAETGFAEAAEALPQTMMHAPYFVTSLVISGLPLAVVALVAGYVSAKHHKQSMALRLGLHRPSLPWSVWTLLLLGSVFVFHIAVGLVWLVEQVIPGDDSLLRLYENISTPWAFVLIAVVGIFPGISEELFFRGFVQRRLLHRYSPVTAIGISTILFALLHVTPHGIALASVMGIWLGVVAWRIGSIWPSVACHAFVNSTWNVYQVGRFQWGVPDLPPMLLGVTSGIVLLVAFACACRKLQSFRPVTVVSA
jgi:membrane protease YdiL (CAAX protease family)